MTKEMLLLKERFGITNEQAEELECKGLYGVFVSPTFDKSEPKNEIHLRHQLFEHFNMKDEKLIAETTEHVSYKIQDGVFVITNTVFSK